MTEEQHLFKKIEWTGSSVLKLAAVELCNDIIENRYKAPETVDFLVSTKVLALIGRFKKISPHKDDPGLKGYQKQLANAYEYSIGQLYYDNKLNAIAAARENLQHFYENQDLYFAKKQS